MSSPVIPPTFNKAIEAANQSDTPFREEIAEIEKHLNDALAKSAGLMQYVLDVEGDSDLHRKLNMYLVPNLHHWLHGAQAGNIRDIKELFDRRSKEASVKEHKPVHMGNGHEVLTKK